MAKDLLLEYKQKIYGDLFNLLKKELEKIAIEFNLNYMELEESYLSELKEILNV